VVAARKLQISVHALARFRERFSEDATEADVAAAVALAVPYGPSYPNTFHLRNGDQVFICSGEVVVTVVWLGMENAIRPIVRRRGKLAFQ